VIGWENCLRNDLDCVGTLNFNQVDCNRGVTFSAWDLGLNQIEIKSNHV